MEESFHPFVLLISPQLEQVSKPTPKTLAKCLKVVPQASSYQITAKC